MKFSHTDKSVRDHPQTATLENDIITITMRVGRMKVGQFSFTIRQWQETNHVPSFNPFSNRAEFMTGQYKREYAADYDSDPCQATRIVDSQVAATLKVYTQYVQWRLGVVIPKTRHMVFKRHVLR